MKPTTAQSISDLQSQRDALERDANALEGTVSFWHTWVLIAAFGTAIFGILAFIVQHTETRRANALTAENKAIIGLTKNITSLQVEQEKTARVELLKALAFRSLNGLQIGEIRRATIAYKDVPLDIIFCPYDTEGNLFAGSLFVTFTAWNPHTYGEMRSTSRGLSVSFDQHNPKAAEAAEHIFAALKDRGFGVNGPFPELPFKPRELLSAADNPSAPLRLTVGYRNPVLLPPDLRQGNRP